MYEKDRELYLEEENDFDDFEDDGDYEVVDE